MPPSELRNIAEPTMDIFKKHLPRNVLKLSVYRNYIVENNSRILVRGNFPLDGLLSVLLMSTWCGTCIQVYIHVSIETVFLLMQCLSSGPGRTAFLKVSVSVLTKTEAKYSVLPHYCFRFVHTNAFSFENGYCLMPLRLSIIHTNTNQNADRRNGTERFFRHRFHLSTPKRSVFKTMRLVSKRSTLHTLFESLRFLSALSAFVLGSSYGPSVTGLALSHVPIFCLFI